MEYIKTLDFITIDSAESQYVNLSDEHLQILNERRIDRLKGDSKTHSWEEVKDFVRNRKSK